MSSKWIVAHRGLHDSAQENSLEAFEQAIRCGADMLEFDVHATGDGALVVTHDDTVGGAPIRSMDLGELHEAAVASRLNIPLLASVLELCAGRILLDIELKCSGCEDLVLRTVYDARFRVNEYLLS